MTPNGPTKELRTSSTAMRERGASSDKAVPAFLLTPTPAAKAEKASVDVRLGVKIRLASPRYDYAPEKGE